MVYRKFLLCTIFLIIACSTHKTTVIEKERIIENNVIQHNQKSIRKKNNYPQNIRLWIKIEDGSIVDNAILSDVKGTLHSYNTEINKYSTKLLIKSDYYNQTWIFNIPHNRKNGEYIIIGYIQGE